MVCFWYDTAFMQTKRKQRSVFTERKIGDPLADLQKPQVGNHKYNGEMPLGQ